MKTIRLGTRRSLLAWAQSGWVAREIERLNRDLPDPLQVELVGIDTRGDRILDVSLRNIEGKEFFVAELDEALRSGKVDLTVHSMKDLSLERPEEFTLAAIPRRENCRDVVLFGPRVLERIRSGKTLKIGTSSPRRIENIPPFLEKALPKFSPQKTPTKLELLEIRGNVNTRLARVHEPEDSPRHLDAVVLAFAGLIRLWADPAGRTELEKLLSGVRWMILPLRECPTAPAQGALAVECRRSDLLVQNAIARLHDSQTAQNVDQERTLLSNWGGGCHQKLGASAITSQALSDLGTLFFVRGRKPDETFISEFHWSTPPAPQGPIHSWDGHEWRKNFDSQEKRIELQSEQLKNLGKAVFVAHSRAVAPPWAPALSDSRVWTSGTASWFKLAEQGVWVEGCAENLGFEFLTCTLTGTLKEPILQLPLEKDWTILTHEQAVSGWKQSQVLATYSLPVIPAEQKQNALEKLKTATHIFWSSGSQFDEFFINSGLRLNTQVNTHHACGPGKTADHLRKAGMNPTVFPSVEEWRKWIKTASL